MNCLNLHQRQLPPMRRFSFVLKRLAMQHLAIINPQKPQFGNHSNDSDEAPHSLAKNVSRTFIPMNFSSSEIVHSPSSIVCLPISQMPQMAKMRYILFDVFLIWAVRICPLESLWYQMVELMPRLLWPRLRCLTNGQATD